MPVSFVGFDIDVAQMNPTLTRMVAIAAAIVLSACTTLQTINPVVGTTPSQREEVTGAIHAGDRIEVTGTDGQTRKIIVTDVTPVEISGDVVDSGVAVKLPISEISKIDKANVSGWKTTGLVVTLTAATALAIAAVLASRLLALEARSP